MSQGTIDKFTEDLHKVETVSECLPDALRASLARSFRAMSSADKDAARELLFQDLIKGAESLGHVIGQVKRLLAIPEGFQALPLNGVSVESRLREAHARLVDAAGLITEAGGLLFPEA